MSSATGWGAGRSAAAKFRGGAKFVVTQAPLSPGPSGPGLGLGLDLNGREPDLNEREPDLNEREPDLNEREPAACEGQAAQAGLE